jgi:hypothetical protein
MINILKTVLITIGILLTAFLMFFFVAFYSFFDGMTTTYNAQDLIRNYKLKQIEIDDVVCYVKSITPIDKEVDIEFENNNSLSIFHLKEKNIYETNWSLHRSSSKTNSLLRKLGWTKKNLEIIKEKLDAANCISIETGEPFTVGYQRSGMGMYFYKIFEKPLSDSLKNEYNDKCTYILYNDRIAFEYGGGAIGSQCFETL